MRKLTFLLLLLATPLWAQRQPMWGSSKANFELSQSLTSGGYPGLRGWATSALPTCTTNQRGLAYDTTTNLPKFCNGTSWFNFYDTGSSFALTAGTMTLETATSLRDVTSSYTWSNAQVAALAGTAAPITVVTLPAKTQVVNTAVVITGAGVTGKKATGTITLTGIPSPGVRAVGTITMSGVAVADEQFVIGAQTFTWKASRSGAGEVTIGADAPAAVVNLVAAITADLATVTASDGAGDTVVVRAVAYGVSGNAIDFTETSTNMAVDDSGGGHLGGTTLGVAPDAFTVGAQAFTYVVSGTATGNVVVGASAPATITNIVTSITRDLATVTAVDGTGDVVDITAVTAGTGGNSLALTEDVDTGNVSAVSGAGTLTGGEDLSAFAVSCGTNFSNDADNTNDYDDLIVDSSAAAAANTVYGDAAADRGTNLGWLVPSYTGTTALKCTFASTGTNLANVLSSTGRVILTTRLLP